MISRCLGWTHSLKPGPWFKRVWDGCLISKQIHKIAKIEWYAIDDCLNSIWQHGTWQHCIFCLISRLTLHVYNASWQCIWQTPRTKIAHTVCLNIILCLISLKQHILFTLHAYPQGRWGNHENTFFSHCFHILFYLCGTPSLHDRAVTKHAVPWSCPTHWKRPGPKSEDLRVPQNVT